ncbi:hypothetical protein XMG59_002310 [Marinobacterium sp. xm-g-59]|uniref:heparin lyase I family protein n=1 Tax=Marinobacterium sp. xm-g-59 TaxID=2497748 RepID=UPI0015689C4D|nr:heparin lyase I family protein [Marinobacterium sp. xm-g-59]NRP96191.1 hypothetical protein [Marinobacterium sp. xm-g-59]
MNRLVKTILISGCLAMTGCQTLDKGSFGQFKRSLNNKSYGYSVVPDPTDTAPTEFVERFEVRSGDCSSGPDWSDCSNDRERSELSGPKDNYQGSEFWYGWSLYLPPDYPNIYPTKTALAQFHQKNSPPAFMFQNSNGGYWIDRNFGNTTHLHKIIEDDDLRGKWNRIEVHANWHKKNGFFVVYVNGQLKWRYEGPTMTSDAVYFKYGIYRSFMSRYKIRNSVDEVPPQVAYFSNVKRSKSREGLMP